MAILGIVAGQTGVFTGVPNGALQAGSVPTWAADDPTVVVTANPDGLGASAAVPLTDTQASFNLTQSGVNSAGAAISTTVNVPVTQPAPAPATGFTINQVS